MSNIMPKDGDKNDCVDSDNNLANDSGSDSENDDEETLPIDTRHQQQAAALNHRNLADLNAINQQQQHIMDETSKSYQRQKHDSSVNSGTSAVIEDTFSSSSSRSAYQPTTVPISPMTAMNEDRMRRKLQFFFMK